MGHREDLEELRDGLFESFRTAKPEVSAQIAGQLRLILRELDSLPVKGASAVDELASKRRRRKSGVSDSTGTG